MQKNKQINAKIKNVLDVAAWRMCVGCGACKAVCPEKRIVLKNVVDEGIRPFANEVECKICKTCLTVCPGIGMDNDTSEKGEIKTLKQGWGTILELYEGSASDPEIRFKGSSGGVTNALALFCIEKFNVQRVVHTRADTDMPWINTTTTSTSREGLLAAAGSRYAPASPAEGIKIIESEPGNSVFIGKPCDIAAYYKAIKIVPGLKKKTSCTIGIFCAGTPSTKGTLDLFDKIGVNKDQLDEFKYRGCGWPGMTGVRLKGKTEFVDKMTYMESWGFIQKYRPLRCYQCPDGTSEFADIACGDPWYQKANPEEPGISLVLARTARGKEILEQAVAAGYINLKKIDKSALVIAQKNLLEKRGWIWGRLITMRMFGIPAPVFKGFSLFALWLKVSPENKIRSIYGTVRRVITRKYWKKVLFSICLK